MKSYLLISLVILVLILSSCSNQALDKPQDRCDTCPSPGSWSYCADSMKTRNSYKCSSDNDYACEAYIEQSECKTELSFKGQFMDVKVSPFAEDHIEGMIKVEAFSVPSETDLVTFMLVPADIKLDNLTDADRARLLQSFDVESTYGWSAIFDTLKVENGFFNIVVFPSSKNHSPDKPWLDWAQTQVVVKN
ncbi:MAG: hypothetical protein AABX19_03750 [Nanoarchaeota archaeon]